MSLTGYNDFNNYTTHEHSVESLGSLLQHCSLHINYKSEYLNLSSSQAKCFQNVNTTIQQ